MDSIQEYISILLILLASTILLQAIFTRARSKFHLPPSPLTLPIIGHFHLLIKSPLHKAAHKLSNRYGPLIHIYFGSTPMVFVSSSEIAKEIFKTKEASFSNRPANIAISYLTYNASDLGFAPYGTYWKFMKKICMSELLNGRMLDQLLPIRQEEINRFLKILKGKGEAHEVVNVSNELLKLTNSIVMRMTISKSCFNEDDEAHLVTERVRESAMLSGMFNLADYFWFCKRLDLQGIGKKLKVVRDRFDTMMENIIQEHEEERSKYAKKDRDVLDALLTIYEDQNSEVKITRDNIKAFLVDMFTGGTDTTAVTLEWSLAELINHPSVMEKARKEIESITGRERIVMESDIVKLPYLQAIVKETLRLHPPSPFIIRDSTENCTIAGFDIPAKTQIFTNVWAIGRDPKHWDNPLEFRPERFLTNDDESENDSKVEVRGHHYQLLPFGSGRRSCPGISLALNVTHTTLASMIHCFEWKSGVEGNDSVDMKEGPSFILSRAQPLICVPTPRFMPFPSV